MTQGETAEYAIYIENLQKAYTKGVNVLDNISFGVKKGDIVGYLGPNGSGKTTTIKILTNLLAPTSGKAYIDGIDVNKNPKEALGKVGALIEVPGVYDYLTPHQTLTYFGQIHGMQKERKNERIKEVLKLVKLSDWQHKKIGSFSTGMQRRFGIATAIFHEPEILILDEPVIGLDPKGIKEIREMIKQFQQDGITIFLSSHLLHEVAETCDSVIFLDGSKIIANDTVQNIVKRLNISKINVELLEPVSEEKLAALRQIDIIEGFETENSTLRIDFDGKNETSAEILARLISADFKISAYSPESVSLEDFYVSMMSDERGVN